ncbi:ABC transporter permease [Paenibacillaceae bacterium WGS1546]|uniref:ABC transporter permease n=1 Tax=Cohnella sp. WGS1546 TaxID=3366810 RepID=UPI00372D1460
MKTGSFTKHYYLMLLPGLLWIAVFSIYPMTGIAIAFQDFKPGRGMFGSEWIGLDTFAYMFSLNDTKQIFMNTLSIALMKMVAHLLVPLVFALMLHELRQQWLKRSIQTIVYLPHFLSWVILSGIVLDFFSLGGPINQLRTALGFESVLFFTKADLFPFLVVGSDIWKEFGFSAVIYLAALTSVHPALYEAAAIDGAGRFRRLWHITLPGIRTTVVLLAVLSLGNVLNAGFDQVFNLYNALVYSTGDIIDTWVYRTGLLSLQYGLATAVGLLKSVIGFLLIAFSYFLAYRLIRYRIF